MSCTRRAHLSRLVLYGVVRNWKFTCSSPDCLLPCMDVDDDDCPFSIVSKSWQWRSVQFSRSVSVGWENRSSFDLCDLLHLQNDDDYDMRSSSNVRVYKRTHIMYTRLGYGVHHVAGWWRRWANWVRINLTSKNPLLYGGALTFRMIWERKFNFPFCTARRASSSLATLMCLCCFDFTSFISSHPSSHGLAYEANKKLIVYQIGSRVHHMLQWFTFIAPSLPFH